MQTKWCATLWHYEVAGAYLLVPIVLGSGLLVVRPPNIPFLLLVVVVVLGFPASWYLAYCEVRDKDPGDRLKTLSSIVVGILGLVSAAIGFFFARNGRPLIGFGFLAFGVFQIQYGILTVLYRRQLRQDSTE